MKDTSKSNSIAGYTGSCTNLCTVDRVKKPVSGVRILQDKFPTSLLDSVWNLCNWQPKVQGKAILEQIIYRDFLCIFKLSSVTASRCVLGNLLMERMRGPSAWRVYQ
ncbi:hypothetical protein NC652_040800 [Populus alba x Populus x berolinensis]|nr:hypothetical protein NC652_040800 [Populus alba x Populus x berolinensis]